MIVTNDVHDEDLLYKCNPQYSELQILKDVLVIRKFIFVMV